MVHYKINNLILGDADILCNVVDCEGKMITQEGEEFKDKVICKQSFLEYKDLCEMHGEDNLGKTFFTTDIKLYHQTKIVANLFAFERLGNSYRLNYDALDKALKEVYLLALETNKSVAIYQYFGCEENYTGSWDMVHNIISKYFECCDAVECYIYTKGDKVE